jgi:hypothetical protein
MGDIFNKTVLPSSFPQQTNTLVIGAGGGFDFLCGLPIALELERLGGRAILGSYSFTNLTKIERAERLGSHLIGVTADSSISGGDYFPEKHLARWFRQSRQDERIIWCLPTLGVVPTTQSYNELIDRYGIDTVICTDGGVDGIFRGDEYDLGTPSMDSVSVIATSLCKARHKIYACTAFGIEGAESGLSHAQVLNRMADMVRMDAMLGIGAVLDNTPEGKDFRSAAEFIHRQMSHLHQSTIVSSILAAMDGKYGRVSVNAKTQERQPWISPLTLLYWYFQAEAVAKLKLFYRDGVATSTVQEMSSAIESLRTKNGIMPFESIPV